MKQTLKSILNPTVFAVAIIALFFCGCTRTIYTPVETRVETSANTSDTLQTDKISKLIDQLQKSVRTQEKVVIRDSIVCVVDEQGEVKSKEVYRGRDRDYSESEAVQRTTQIYDSLFQRQAARADSILSRLEQEPVIVEKEPSLRSRLECGIAGIAAFCAALGIFFGLRWAKSKIFK